MIQNYPIYKNDQKNPTQNDPPQWREEHGGKVNTDQNRTWKTNGISF